MLEKIGEKISVNLVYNHSTNTVIPQHLKWKNKTYQIQKVGLHYTLYQGSTLIHMFSVCDSDHFFLLSFNTKNLHWTLEQVADDTTN